MGKDQEEWWESKDHGPITLRQQTLGKGVFNFLFNSDKCVSKDFVLLESRVSEMRKVMF